MHNSILYTSDNISTQNKIYVKSNLALLYRCHKKNSRSKIHNYHMKPSLNEALVVSSQIMLHLPRTINRWNMLG